MNLSFSTTWNEHMGELAGKPTFFVEKILAGLIEENSMHWNYLDEYYSFAIDRKDKVVSIQDIKPKVHSIRADPKDRWKVGNKIHFIINPRTPNRFQFAPVLEVKNIQKIQIEHLLGWTRVFIDGEFYGEFFHGLDDIYEWTTRLETLAQNDGFNSVEDFFRWFNEDFSGKIISWTDLER